MTSRNEDTDEEERELALIKAERLMELGWIEFEEAHYDKALVCLQDALAHFKSHGSRAGEGSAFGNLGAVYQNQGKFDQALAHYNQALAIHREVGNHRAEGTS